MFLINGVEQNSLRACDRAIQFGDGCFTTARITDGRVHFLAAHLARLRLACDKLMIPLINQDVLEQEMRSLAAGTERGVLKVILSRGSSSRGYSVSGCQTPTRILSLAAYPAHYQRWRDLGVTLTPSPVTLGRNPWLAGIKHLNRLEQVLIRAHLDQTDADEALVLDSEGWMTECCAANLFWRKGATVFTPRLDQAGVNGIMRQHCIGLLALSDYAVVEVNAKPEALAQADEVIICNALLPVVAVRAFEHLTWSARDLWRWLAPRCECTNEL